MGRIPDETIEAVRDRVDLVELVGRFVALRQSGRSFKGLCPFHGEKTPSFHVHAERQIFHCFGCGAGGNAFTFLMRHENLSFPEAVRALARECGIEIPEADDGETGVAERLRDAADVAQRVYREALRGPEGAAARAHLARRGLDLAAAEQLGIGFAPDRWDAVVRALAAARIPAAVGAQAGLLAARRSGGHYDWLRGRITFPIRDARGRVVGFGGRALADGQEPKYLNTPETPIFRKREALYGLPDALAALRRSGRAVLCEGYFDRIALARAGVEDSLATCGTALTREHARSLRRRVREVVLVFDGDEAGARAVDRSLAVLLPEGLRVRSAALPAQEDPDSLLAREGAEALRRRVDAAPPALEGVIRRAVARGCATPWEKADAVSAAAPVIALVADPVERGEYARQLALAAGARVEDVDAALRRERRGAALAPREEEPEPPPAARPPSPEARALRRLARLVVDHPSAATEVDPAELARLVPDPVWRALLEALLRAAREAGAVDVAALADGLAPDPARELLSLAVSDEAPLEREAARRAIGDTIRWLGRRRQAAEHRETTRRLREDPGGDPAALLAEKQRQIEERRQALAALAADPTTPPTR